MHQSVVDDTFEVVDAAERGKSLNQTDTEELDWLLEEEPDDVKAFIRNAVSQTSDAEAVVSSSDTPTFGCVSPLLYSDRLIISQLSDIVKNAYRKNGIETFGEALSVDWHNLRGVGSRRYDELESYVRACAIEIPPCKIAINRSEPRLSKFCTIEGLFWDPFGILRYVNKSHPNSTAIDEACETSVSSFEMVSTPVEQLDFLSRSDANKLRRAGFFTLEDLAVVDEKALLGIRGMGPKRVNSILDGVRAALIPSKDAEMQSYQEQDQAHPDDLQQAIDELYEGFSNRCTNGLPKELFESWASVAFLQKVDDAEFFEECFKQYIMCLEKRSAANNTSPIGKVTLQQWISGITSEAIRETMRLRFAGFSLDECASELGVTRQRVQQMVAREMSRRPAIVEDRFQQLFDKYDFTEQQFSEAFAVHPAVYRYLKEASKTPKAAKHDARLSMSDPDIPQEQRKAVSDYFDNKKIFVYGKKVEPNKAVLIQEVLKARAADQTHIKAVFEAYTSVLSENGLLDDSKFRVASDRSFLGIIQRADYALLSQGEFVRYYDIDLDSVNNLLAQLNLNDYRGMEISTFLLMSKYPDLMAEYDIRDEYELHFLLRKAGSRNHPEVASCVFGRSPMVEIGCEGIRVEQVEAMIEELAPINVKAFAEAYERRYGVKQLTFLGSWSRQFASHIKNDTFIWVFEELTASEVAYIDEMLVAGCQTIPQIKDGYYGAEPAAFRRKCNAATLRNAGYQVSEQLVFARETDPQQQIRKFLEPGIINLSGVEPLIRNSILFKTELARLLRSYDLVETAQGVYVHIERLKCTRYDCSRFCESIIEQISTDEPFTIESLRRHGSVTGIDELPLNDYARSAVLAAVPGGRLKRTTINGVTFFSKRTGVFGFEDVLRWVIEHKHVETVPDLQGALWSEFACNLRACVVRSYLMRAGLYKYEWGDMLYKVYEHKTNDDAG